MPLADAGAPFGRLPLVDEVDCGKPAEARPFVEALQGVSRVETILGKPCRVLPNTGDKKYFAYRIGQGKGLKPGRAILAGVGLRGLRNWDRRQQFFRDAIANFDTSARGDPHWLAIQFMKTMKVDREAALHVLASFRGFSPDWLAAFTMPTLVVCGREDEDNGAAHELAAALPNAAFAEVPGTHMSSVTKPELGEEIARFLIAD